MIFQLINCLILDFSKNEVNDNYYSINYIKKNILISNGFIKKIDNKLYDCEKIDINENFIIPGLIDAHYHSMDAIIKGYLENKTLHSITHSNLWNYVQESITAKEIEVCAKYSYINSILNGVTCINDNNYYKHSIDILKIAKELNLRVNLFIDDINDYEQKIFEFNEDRLINLGIKIKEEDHINKDYLNKIKNIVTTSTLTSMHVMETKLRKKILSLRFHKSLFSILDKYDILNTNFIASHGIYLTNKDLSLMNKYNIGIVPTIISESRLFDGMFDFKKILENNIPIGLGTDGLFWSNSNINEEMKYRLNLMKSTFGEEINEIDILKQATINNAKICGYKKLGLIKEGYFADFLVIDKKIKEDIIEELKPENILNVYVNGKDILPLAKKEYENVLQDFTKLRDQKIKNFLKRQDF